MPVENALSRQPQPDNTQNGEEIALPILTSALLGKPLIQVTQREQTRMKQQSYGFPHETTLGTLVPLHEYREIARNLYDRVDGVLKHIGHHVEFYVPRVCTGGSPLYNNADAGRYLVSPRLHFWGDDSKKSYITMRHDFELSGVKTHLANDIIFVDQDDRIKLRFTQTAISAFMATFQMEDSVTLIKRIVRGLEIASTPKPMIPKPYPLDTYPIYTSREYQKRTIVDIDPYNPMYLGEKPSREDFKAV